MDLLPHMKRKCFICGDYLHVVASVEIIVYGLTPDVRQQCPTYVITEDRDQKMAAYGMAYRSAFPCSAMASQELGHQPRRLLRQHESIEYSTMSMSSTSVSGSCIRKLKMCRLSVPEKLMSCTEIDSAEARAR